MAREVGMTFDDETLSDDERQLPPQRASQSGGGKGKEPEGRSRTSGQVKDMSKLFVDEDEESISFCVQLGEASEDDVQDLKSTIREHGGLVISNYRTADYVLVDQSTTAGADFMTVHTTPTRRVVSKDFIQESITRRKLVPYSELSLFIREDRPVVFYLHDTLDGDVADRFREAILLRGGNPDGELDNAQVVIRRADWEGDRRMRAKYKNIIRLESPEWLDSCIERSRFSLNVPVVKTQSSKPGRKVGAPRNEYTKQDDQFLVAWMATTFGHSMAGRAGNHAYKVMAEIPEYTKWSSAHTWQSWRERYKNNKKRLDPLIEAYIAEHGTEQPGEGTDEEPNDDPPVIERVQGAYKRPKRKRKQPADDDGIESDGSHHSHESDRPEKEKEKEKEKRQTRGKRQARGKGRGAESEEVEDDDEEASQKPTPSQARAKKRARVTADDSETHTVKISSSQKAVSQQRKPSSSSQKPSSSSKNGSSSRKVAPASQKAKLSPRQEEEEEETEDDEEAPQKPTSSEARAKKRARITTDNPETHTTKVSLSQKAVPMPRKPSSLSQKASSSQKVAPASQKAKSSSQKAGASPQQPVQRTPSPVSSSRHASPADNPTPPRVPSPAPPVTKPSDQARLKAAQSMTTTTTEAESQDASQTSVISSGEPEFPLDPVLTSPRMQAGVRKEKSVTDNMEGLELTGRGQEEEEDEEEEEEEDEDIDVEVGGISQYQRPTTQSDELPEDVEEELADMAKEYNVSFTVVKGQFEVSQQLAPNDAMEATRDAVRDLVKKLRSQDK